MLSSLFADKIIKWNRETAQKKSKVSDIQYLGFPEENKKSDIRTFDSSHYSSEVFKNEENAGIIECL
ncbi:MAG TPA: hypothetical protein VG961_01875 [Ignavibacteria bacterium]|nr:hypothetical protein [Ignavibacteria bacterium]